MLRLFLGSLVVALVLWVWSTVFYVISPIPYYTMSETVDDIAAGEALKKHFPETGTYILPGRYAGDDVRKQMRRDGPVATVYIARDGSPEASVVQILIGDTNAVLIAVAFTKTGIKEKAISSHQRDAVVLESTDANFRPLQITDNANDAAALRCSFPKPRQPGTLLVVIAMGKIQSRDIKSCHDRIAKRFRVVG